MSPLPPNFGKTGEDNHNLLEQKPAQESVPGEEEKKNAIDELLKTQCGQVPELNTPVIEGPPHSGAQPDPHLVHQRKMSSYSSSGEEQL